MGEHDVLLFRYALFHHSERCSIVNAICTIEILKIEVACVALPHPFRLHNESLARSIHQIQDSLLIVKAFRERLRNGTKIVFDIERSNILPRALNWALHGVCPNALVIHVRLRKLQSQNATSFRENERAWVKSLSIVGNALLLIVRHEREFGR